MAVSHYKRIMNAIENSEYCLFRQLITPMTADSTEVEYYEILVRLRETDKVLLLPAEFFPVAQILDKMEKEKTQCFLLIYRMIQLVTPASQNF